MLKLDSEMFHNLCNEAIKDNKKDTFVDAFTEFIEDKQVINISISETRTIITALILYEDN